ncbi:ARM repeat-containing protein, partial [Meira miltonrushii]
MPSTPTVGSNSGQSHPTQRENASVNPNTNQVPSRSLWIGNLNSSTTGQELMHAFAPYGAIESLRLLPEKECGFVNFVELADAVQAREDVLGALNAKLGKLGIGPGGTVRIGFGKIDALPSHTGVIGSDMSSPTRALWVGSIANAVTPATLLSVFTPFGPVESARILTHKNCGFVNFERVDDAVRARKMLNGREVLGSEMGTMRIGFAKVPSRNIEQFPAYDGSPEYDDAVQSLSQLKGAKYAAITPEEQITISDLQLLMRELSRGEPEGEVEADVASVSELRPMMTYYMTIPLVSEVSSGRRFETAKLREIRRGIESGQFSMPQCDRLAVEYIDSIVDLASDYIGNTLVQKFFETCSDRMKMQLLHRLAPHLAMVGCHKNGTWAAQKILDCTNSVEQVQLIGQNLRPYIPGLLLDSFGNYVVQCCLPWSSLNDFVFDAMVDRCWEIAQGRFGARSMRACLENHNVSKRQRKRVAIAVILNSVPLATSPNGSILLTWLLETPELSKSFRLLAPRFTPHLTHLCTHKLASGTVLRLATQKAEPEASHMILKALFESDDHTSMLEEIIVDQVHGSQFITKVLASPTLSPRQRESYSEQV